MVAIKVSIDFQSYDDEDFGFFLYILNMFIFIVYFVCLGVYLIRQTTFWDISIYVHIFNSVLVVWNGPNYYYFIGRNIFVEIW